MSKPSGGGFREQPELLPGMARAQVRAGRAPAKKAVLLTEVDPVARVLVDLPLAHLDRTFDYAVPASMASDAVPGARVKVRFAGQDVDAFILERAGASEHQGRLQPLRRVVSPEPVLSPIVADLIASIAKRYAGARADVLRLAIPPRHATTEKVPSAQAPVFAAPLEAPSVWSELVHGPEFIGALVAGKAPRAVWAPAPGSDWPRMIAHAAAATLAAGRGVLICVPDGKDVARVSTALEVVLGPGQHVALTAQSGPAARYAEFLRVSRGVARVVVGTRAAAFVPIVDLGLVVLWDDGDDLFAEPRAPYPHTREVLLTRAELEGAGALIGGFARTVEAHYLVVTGWAASLNPPRQLIRDRVTVSIAGASDAEIERDPQARSARIPRQVFEGIRAGLEKGPVLVQTPRAGYAASLACERCRTPARCTNCTGPLVQRSADRAPACGWCGTDAGGFSCSECGHRGLRAPVRGDARTAEELGRMFPSTPVRTSSGDRVVSAVGDAAAIVVATPGAEPIAESGYAAVVLLDTWLALGRLDLRTNEEALRRWMNAAGLARPGGRVVVVGDPANATLQALVRWDPAGFASRELEERRSAHLPPASRLATITGEAGAVDDALTLLELPEGTEVLGPLPVEGVAAPRSGGGRSMGPGSQAGGQRGAQAEVRAVMRAPRLASEALSEALGELQRVRSARKLDAVRVQVDPYTL